MAAHLEFRKGFAEGCEINFDIDFTFEYDANLEKKIRSIILYNLDSGKKISIPWAIFQFFVENKPTRSFLNGSGLKMSFIENKKQLEISDLSGFNLLLHENQLYDIIVAARRAEKNFTYAVEDVLREFIAQRA